MVEAQLRAHLREAIYQPGNRLPGERELAEQLGVGRTALRPVLEKLIAEGSLERRPQSGTYLSRRPAPSVVAGNIAIIAPIELTGAQGIWLHQVVSAIERTLAPQGLKTRILDQLLLADDPCSAIILARQVAEDRPLAAILIHPSGSRETIACALALLHDAGVPPIVVSSRTYTGLASHVYFDSEWGAYLATRYLLQLGHRGIGFAGAASGHQWVQERLRGYQQALSTFEIQPNPEWMCLAEPGERLASPEDGAQSARVFLSERGMTAVVAANDVVALGFWQACRDAGAAIPERFSLVGFDNDPASLAAGLTTIERPSATVGEAVARVTLEQIGAGARTETMNVRLRPVLIERQSTGRCAM